MKAFKLTMTALLIIFAFTSMQVYAAGGTDSAADTGTQAGVTQGQMDQGQSPLKATDVLGKSINDQQGQNIGEVADLVIGQEGDVQFVVLKPSGELQKEDQMIPIPWQKIQAQGGQEALTATVDMQTLQDAPTISGDQLQELSNQDMQNQVRGYYGVEEKGMQQRGKDMMDEMGMDKDKGAHGMGMDQQGKTDRPKEY